MKEAILILFFFAIGFVSGRLMERKKKKDDFWGDD